MFAGRDRAWGRGPCLVDDLLKVCVEGMYVFRVCVRGGGVGVV